MVVEGVVEAEVVVLRQMTGLKKYILEQVCSALN